ncbi:hypothetical protein BH10ACT1_BH10ACT1_34550 [soil metagenome]
MRRAWRSVLVLVLLAAVSLAGCGGDDGDSSSKSSGGGSGAPAKTEAAGGDAKAAVDASAPVADRDITYTAALVVRVADAEKASDEGTALAGSAKGYVAGQQADLQGQQQSTLTIRVPSSAFRQVLDQLADLGVVQDKSIDSTDVTDQVVDLSGRLESQQASAARLRTLLGSAATAGDLVTIEQELSKRESEIESLEGKLRVLDDQFSLATITVRFTEKAEPKPDHDDDGAPGFVDALKAGGGTLLAIGRGLVVFLGFVLPFLPLVGLGWFGFRAWRRRHPRVAPAPMAPWPSAAARPSPPTKPWPTTSPSPPPPPTTPPQRVAEPPEPPADA